MSLFYAINPAFFWLFVVYIGIYCDYIRSATPHHNEKNWVANQVHKASTLGRFGDPLLLDSDKNALHRDKNVLRV